MNGWIRWSTVIAVAAVAGVAAWVSYIHALAVVRPAGEVGAIAYAYPVTIDGLIYSASMVLLDSARRSRSAPALAYWLLGAGIGATVATNVWSGLSHGPLGAVVAAWPAAALVGSYELLMLLVRASAEQVAQDEPVQELQQVVKDRFDAAKVALNASIAAGYARSANSLVTDFGITRQEAKELVEQVTIMSNGHKPDTVAA